MDYLYKNKKWISTILVTALIYARCDLGLALGNVYVVINVLVNGLAFLFCVFLFFKDKVTTKKAVLNIATLWLVIFSVMVFIYGHYKLGTPSDMYSRQFHLLTIAPALFIMIILFNNKDDILDIISIAGCVVIVSTIVTSLIFDPVWGEWLLGMSSRVGATPAGTCIDTGNLLLIMMIPLMYQVVINRQFKKYLLFVLLAVFQIVATGAKSSVLPIVIVLAIMLLGASTSRKVLVRNLIILAVLAIVGFMAIMLIPPLYGIIGDRIVELFSGIGSTEYDLHTSTGQRMAVIAEFKKHFGEHPIFGHGFYAFKEMPYSQLEEYRPNEGTVIAYRHIHTHMNYLELLFSFGIFGFVLYYWFPVYIFIKSLFTKKKMSKLIVLSFMISFIFMDLGIDMFYKYMTAYYTYLVSYCLLKDSSES